MHLGRAVVAARGVAAGDVALAQAGHFHRVGRVAAQAPARLLVHRLLAGGALGGILADKVYQHHELEILRHLPARVGRAAARRPLDPAVEVVGVRLRADGGAHPVIELRIVTLTRTEQVGGRAPELVVGALPARLHHGRIFRRDHALRGQDVLPGAVAGHVVEVCRRHLAEIPAAHPFVADALQLVQLEVFLLLRIAECLDGLVLIVVAQRGIALHAERIREHRAVGRVGPGGHRGAAGLEHHRPVLVGIGHALRVAFAVADAQEEVHLVARLVDQVGDAVAALADAQGVLRQAAARHQVRQQDVIDVDDVGQVAVPVEGVGMSAAHVHVDRIAGQAVLPEGGSLRVLEMRLVPDVAAQLAPVGVPGLQVRLVDDEARRILAGGETRLTRHRHDTGIDGLAQAHIVVAAHGVAVRLIIDVVGDVEIHAAAHAIHDQAVAAGGILTEIDGPDGRAGQVLAARFPGALGGGLPRLHRAHQAGLAGLHVEQIDVPALIGGIVARAAVAEPEIQVGGLDGLLRGVAQDVDVDGLGLRGPAVILDRDAAHVGAHLPGNRHRVGAALLHRLLQVQEDPVVQLAGERVVGVHRLALAPGCDGGSGREGRVVPGRDEPLRCVRGRGRVQTGMIHHQGVVAVGERMPQIGARARGVVAVAHLAVAEVQHQVFVVHDLDAQVVGRARRQAGQQAHGREEETFHIVSLSRYSITFFCGSKGLRSSSPIARTAVCTSVASSASAPRKWRPASTSTQRGTRPMISVPVTRSPRAAAARQTVS